MFVSFTKHFANRFLALFTEASPAAETGPDIDSGADRFLEHSTARLLSAKRVRRIRTPAQVGKHVSGLCLNSCAVCTYTRHMHIAHVDAVVNERQPLVATLFPNLLR
jgi:hypothetical protein